MEKLNDIKPVGYYNGAHGFLYDELDKDCYCLGGCTMAPVYTEEQMQEYAKAKVAETVELYAKDGSIVPLEYMKDFVIENIFKEAEDEKVHR